MTLLLRIDWSPESTEVSVVDIAAGSTLAVATETHHPASDGHDVDRWLRSATVAAHAALESLVVIGPSADDIRLVEVCTAAPGGLVALDAAGAPLHEALLGAHAESDADASWLLQQVDGGADSWVGRSGVPPTAGSTVALLSFLHRTDADAWNAMARCTLPVGLLAERLGGRAAIGEMDAIGTAVADRRTPRTWCVDLLGVVDADRDWVATMPEIVESGAPIGVLDPTIAAAIGVPEGRPLHVGPVAGG